MSGNAKNRRKTVIAASRRWSLRRLVSRSQNRRLRPKAKAQPSTPRDFRRLLAAVGAVALAVVKVTAVLIVLAGLGVGGYISYQRVMSSTYFNVDRIELRSVRRAPAHQVRALAESARGKNILTLDLAALRRAVESHPWVKEAAVERELPRTVKVSVVEHKARALLLMGHLYLVNPEGLVFKRADPEEQEGMPVITGLSRMTYLNHPGQARKRIQKALVALDRYYSQVRPPLSEVHVSQRGQITLHLRQGGVAIRLGSELSQQRLAKLDAVCAALGPEARRARVVFLDNEARKDRVTVRMGSYD